MSPDTPMPDARERAAATATGMPLALWAHYTPDTTAIICDKSNRTFTELNANCNKLVRALRARGVSAGDSVAILMGNRAEFAESVFACIRAGLRYTPINRYLSPEEVAYIINDCEASAILGDARFAELLQKTSALCPNATVRLAVSDNSDDCDIQGSQVDGFDDYTTTINAQTGADITNPQLGARMLYTSGTTGRPKGVVRPPNYSTGLAAITSAPKYAAGMGQMNLCTGPYYHGGPLSFSLLAPLSQGVGIVIMERWDAEQALKLIDQYGITHTHMVPIMFHRLLQLPQSVRDKYDVSSMQYILHGAAPCPVASKRGMLDWFGPVLWEYFAATEGSGASCSPQQWLDKPGTVGLPPSPDHVRILDDNNAPCPAGVVGRIFLRGEGELDFQYLGDSAKTAAARQGSYFTVGDIGYLDEDGFLFLTDRSSSVINSGGVNIYPAEVEAALLEHPSVKDAAAIGTANAEWGEEVKAVVQVEALPTDATALQQTLIEHCRERIAHFKCPRSVDFVLQLPRDDNGKLYRRKLLEQYRTN